MRSAGAPTATVLVIITMVFAPVMKHNHWVNMLVGHSQTRVVVACPDTSNCPRQASITETVTATDSSQAAVDAATARAVAQGVADYQVSQGQGDGEDAGDGDHGNGHGNNGHGNNGHGNSGHGNHGNDDPGDR
jgi:hypothetical protein